MSAALPLRIAVVQFAPKIGQIQANLARARELCRQIQPRSVDLVCLPEMIFTGYVFSDHNAILPYLETPRTGPTSLFCSDLAKKLECHVVAGYPEKLVVQEESHPEQSHLVGANSSVIYGPQGQWVGGYRKTNLFETDMTWAIPGTGFATFTLPAPLRTVTLGICMDLNAQPPAQWTTIDGPYEIADHAAANRSNILVLLNAWLDSGIVEEDETEEEGSDWSTLNFWASRLRPLWVNASTRPDIETGHETVVVVCNRSGTENEKTFAGSSALFSMKTGAGRPKLLDKMGRREEGVRIWNLLV